MASLRDIFKKYTGFLRDLKLVYVINNYLNAGKLEHNKKLYKKYGVKKSVFSNISSQEIPRHQDGIPWIDKPNAREVVQQHPDFKTFDSVTQEAILNFIDNGYLVLKNFYPENETDSLNQSIEEILSDKKAGFNFTDKKIMDAYKVSNAALRFFKNKELIRLLDFLLGRRVIPFQSINFIEGSEQRAHSDFIHMTTEPQGYLIATWTALEDCDAKNGPLFYYPKSHRSPYVLSPDYETGHTKVMLGKKNYPNYEEKIGEVIEEYQFEKKYFHANRGDVLIWHSNLLHGGSPIIQKGTTRKSMVCHYYAEDVICYHELTQRPALMK